MGPVTGRVLGKDPIGRHCCFVGEFGICYPVTCPMFPHDDPQGQKYLERIDSFLNAIDLLERMCREMVLWTLGMEIQRCSRRPQTKLLYNQSPEGDGTLGFWESWFIRVHCWIDFLMEDGGPGCQY